MGKKWDKVSNLLERRDSLRNVYHNMVTQRDEKRIADRFKTQELIYTIEWQKKQLAYSNRILVIVGVTTLMLTGSIVALVVFYRQRRRRILEMQDKDREIRRLRTHPNSTLQSLSAAPELSPQEELFRIAEQKIALERTFLNKELSLELLVQMLDTNRSYLSATINSHANCNFNQWINDYRNFKRYTGMTTSQYLKEKETLLV